MASPISRRSGPSPTTEFGIGSISKIVHDADIAQLVDEGKIDLMRRDQYLPDFK